MESMLMIMFVQGKIFVGKSMPGTTDRLEECIECVPMMAPDGRYMIIGNLIGTIQIPKDCLLGEVSNDSMYYKNYFQATSKVEVIQPNPFDSSGKRRIN